MEVAGIIGACTLASTFLSKALDVAVNAWTSNKRITSDSATLERSAKDELLQTLMVKIDILEKGRLDDQALRLKDREDAHMEKLHFLSEQAELSSKISLQSFRISELEGTVAALTKENHELKAELENYKKLQNTTVTNTSIITTTTPTNQGA